MANETLETFKAKLGEVIDVNAAVSVLQWDEEVNMPPKAAPARGLQLATLSTIAHRMFTDKELGDSLRRLAEDGSLSSDDAKLVSETLYDYDRATKLPDSFVNKFSRARSKAYTAWVEAREKSDFALFRPHLETMVELLKERAELMGYEGSPYNALLEDYERGMTVEQLKEIFGELAEKQGALVKRIVDSGQQPDTSWMEGPWDDGVRWDLTIRVLRDMGYDFDAGRQDKSIHPFTTNFDLYDVRVTTRIEKDDLFSGWTGSMHEGGHGLYEQGFRSEDQRTTLAEAPSLGIHESQSRLWENNIGRSRAFWKHYASVYREAFGNRLDSVSAEDMYRAINRVQPSLIRVEADECTYNLHVILRFEIETDLIEGVLEVKDVPEVWNEKMKRHLGVSVPNDAKGCLQDIHWSHGSMGYFPTYALGNLYAAQLFEKILADMPRFWDSVEEGDFKPLLSWLRENVHRHGRRKSAIEIVRDATGKEPSSAPFLAYLETKYGELYGA